MIIEEEMDIKTVLFIIINGFIVSVPIYYITDSIHSWTDFLLFCILSAPGIIATEANLCTQYLKQKGFI